MSEWTTDELARIGSDDELQIAALRADGTLANPVTIWVVPYGDNLYVRSVRGRNGAWFRGAQKTHKGRIQASGIVKDVTFDHAEDEINNEVDAAYRDKYRGYAPSIVNTVLTPGARSTTIRLVPR